MPVAASIWISTSASIASGGLHERHFAYTLYDGLDEHPITALQVFTQGRFRKSEHQTPEACPK